MPSEQSRGRRCFTYTDYNYCCCLEWIGSGQLQPIATILFCFQSCSDFARLLQAFCPSNRQDFTAPVFRRHTKLDEGFIGGGRWKYNVKASELYPFIRTASSQEEDAEGKETVGDDATVASKDCAAGLIRMGLLPRIRYILEVFFSLYCMSLSDTFVFTRNQINIGPVCTIQLVHLEFPFDDFLLHAGRET